MPLFTHKFSKTSKSIIVNGFELCPKENILDENLKTFVKVQINNCDKNTEKIKTGRYPFWNEIIEITEELDWKLDFTPDLVVILYKKVLKRLFNKNEEVDEEIGRFTV